ncbi:MAG TPA: GAF domain-containing protein [Solirubrobacterales bacterium]
MTTREESLSSEALDVVVKLLFELDEERGLEDFYDRICEAVCLQTSMERAVLFLYDAERKLVLPAGSHGVYREFIVHGYGTLEETPIAQRALAEDRVVETDNLGEDVPARYSNLPGVSKLTCTPVAAAGRWLGVIFADRDGEPFDLTEVERSTMHALGRTAALASHVREVTRQLERGRRLSERIDLAREVHERVTQRLFGVSMALGSDRPLAGEDRDRCAAEIEAALGDLREALIGSAGSSLLELQDGGLRSELDRLGRQYKRLPLVVDWREGVDVPEKLEPLAVSTLNEALRNAEKHADPTEVRVTISARDGVFALEVRNDGLREPAGEGAAGSRMGLRLASYEALQRGGMLEYGREEDRWRVRLVLPSS